MNTDVILNYLMELERNNNREFYHAHKKEYQAAKTEFEALVQELIFRIGKTDGSVLGCVPGIPVSATTNLPTIRRFAPIFPAAESCRCRWVIT